MPKSFAGFPSKLHLGSCGYSSKESAIGMIFYAAIALSLIFPLAAKSDFIRG